jgi:NAD(P)-dependent dehydrogenase (short-subunit alcohol dehydrogenase family)
VAVRGANGDLFDLTGKVAVVTGGSRGLGREMVLGFARAGAEVMIVSRKIEACRELAAAVTEETGRRAVAHACHVGRWAELDALVETAFGSFGSVDIWVNNAGMSPVVDRGPLRQDHRGELQGTVPALRPSR